MTVLAQYSVHFLSCTDIVSAYKGLLKEKEALEASFQCLTNSKQQANKKLSSASVDNGDKDNDQEKSDKEKCAFSDPLQVNVISWFLLNGGFFKKYNLSKSDSFIFLYYCKIYFGRI